MERLTHTHTRWWDYGQADIRIALLHSNTLWILPLFLVFETKILYIHKRISFVELNYKFNQYCPSPQRCVCV